MVGTARERMEKMCVMGYTYDGVITLLRPNSPDARLQHRM